MFESDVCDEKVDDVLSDVCDEEVDDVLTSMDHGYDLQLDGLHELYIRHYQDGPSVGGGPPIQTVVDLPQICESCGAPNTCRCIPVPSPHFPLLKLP